MARWRTDGSIWVRRGGYAALLLAAAIAGVVFLEGGSDEELPPLQDWHFAEPVTTLHAATAESIRQDFAAQDYTLDAVVKDKSIPRVFVEGLPDGLKELQPVKAREALFIQIMLPLIARANERIAAEREALESILEDLAEGNALSDPRQEWLTQLAELYGTKPGDRTALRDRVDVMPASLVLAQAINESGWGTGRLARQANNLFGQHASAHSRSAVKAAGADVKVASFATLLDSVMAYMMNLNSHRAYAELREVRAGRRRAGELPDGYAMASGLSHYSTRGEAYVKELRNLMKGHDLSGYDGILLASEGGAVRIEVDPKTMADKN